LSHLAYLIQAMRKGQILDLALHAFEEGALVRLLLYNSHHSGVFAGRNNAVREVIAGIVHSHQLAVAVLEVPAKVDHIADLQLGRSHVMISGAWNNMDLARGPIYYRENLKFFEKRPYLAPLDWKAVNGARVELDDFLDRARCGLEGCKKGRTVHDCSKKTNKSGKISPSSPTSLAFCLHTSQFAEKEAVTEYFQLHK